MDFTGRHDYLAVRPYEALRRVRRAANFTLRLDDRWWAGTEREAGHVASHLVVTHRINPYSPNTHVAAHFSAEPFSTSNQLNVVVERDLQRAKAQCVLLNSALFWAYFFLLKEESTGRYINVRFYDLAEMQLYPRAEHIGPLSEIFDEFGNQALPSLREQFDRSFEARYDDHWTRQRTRRDQLPLFELGAPDPDPVRVAFDLAVCRALGSEVDEEELRVLYQTIVQEMIITRGLTSD